MVLHAKSTLQTTITTSTPTGVPLMASVTSSSSSGVVAVAADRPAAVLEASQAVLEHMHTSV